METEPESITDIRVRMYREALDQQRKKNELAEREAEQAKEAEAATAKEPVGPDRAHATTHEGGDKA